VRDISLLAVAIGMVLSRIIRRGDASPAPFGLLYPVLIFGATILISILFSQYRDISLPLSAYVSIGFLFFFAVQDIAGMPSAFRRMFITLSLVVFLLGLDGIYQYWMGQSLLTGSSLFAGRVKGSLPHPNDLALIPILLPFSITLLLQERSRVVKGLILISILLAFVTVILSQSRNAWFGLAIGLGVFLFHKKTQKAIIVFACIILILFSAALYFDLGNVQQRLNTLMNITSETRIGIYLVAVEMFKESPVLGKGLFTFGEFYLPYIEKIQLPQGYTPEIAIIPWAHNLYLEILAERGLIGFAGFIAPIIAMGAILRKFVRQQTGSQEKMFAFGLTASLLTFLCMGLFDLTFLKDWVLLIFLLLAAMIARLPMLTSSFSET
jgi:O-antigen ligase